MDAQAGGAVTETIDLYKTLGVHPDVGGDAQRFAAVALAYKVLSNQQDRDHYDVTGELQSADTTAAQALNALGGVVNALIEDLIKRGCEALPGDLAERVREHIGKEVSAHEQKIAAVDKAARLYADIEQRTGLDAEDVPDIVRGILGQRREHDQDLHVRLTATLAIWRKAAELAVHLTCQAPVRQPEYSIQYSNVYMGGTSTSTSTGNG